MSCARYCYMYDTKINIYNHPAFFRTPTCPALPPPSAPLYQPIGACGRPYPTPSYYPPAPYCSSCKCGHTCKKE